MAIAGRPFVVANVDGKGAALALDDRRADEQSGNPRAVERRRHHQQSQVGPQRTLHVERQRQAEIAVERALVELVEEHGRDARQVPGSSRIMRASTPSVTTRIFVFADAAVFHAHGIADRAARLLAEQLGHAAGCGACSEPARLEQNDLSRRQAMAHRAAPAAPASSCRRRAAPPRRHCCRGQAPRSAPAARRRQEVRAKVFWSLSQGYATSPRCPHISGDGCSATERSGAAQSRVRANGFQRTVPSLASSRTMVSRPEPPTTARPTSDRESGYSWKNRAPRITAQTICE